MRISLRLQKTASRLDTKRKMAFSRARKVAILVGGVVISGVIQGQDVPYVFGSSGVSAGNGANQATVLLETERMGLPDLIALAMSSHPSVQAKRTEALAAASDVDAARWQYYPSPSMAIEHGNASVSTAAVSLTQPLWAGGRIDASMDYAKARQVSADFATSEAKVELALSVVSAYQAWLQASERSRAFLESVRFHETQVQRIKRRVAGGVSADVDLQLVHSRLAQVKGDLSSADSFGRAALSRLSQTVGHTLSAGMLQVPELSAVAFDLSLAEALRDAASINPSLKRLESDIVASESEVRVKRSALWPAVSLRAEHRRNDILGGSEIPQHDNRVMVLLQFSPGSGLSSLSAIDSATARTNAIRHSKEAMQKQLTDRIVTEYESYVSANDRLDTLFAGRNGSEEILNSYSRLFVAGKKSWLDVLNAARELTQAEVALSDAKSALIGSAVKLRIYSQGFENLVGSGSSASQ